MKGKVFFLGFLLASKLATSQSGDTVSKEYLSHVINFLASDSLKGRGNFTPGLLKAAHFIAKEFENDSLSYFPGQDSYFQPFSIKTLKAKDAVKDTSGNYDPSKILLNIISVLPGKAYPGEAIIFSAHYDHVGTQKGKRDTIFNGANDNASGTAALLALARYYAQKNDNARTLIFCAFAGEELGLKGSQDFTRNINVKNIVAVANIEMIGRNAYKKTSFFITGERYSSFATIMKNNLKNSPFRVVREPGIQKELFSRSDNYSFAKLGVPAHSIMSSDDDDVCYHLPCDEVKRMDMDHIAAIVKAIVVGLSSIIEGKETPSRINTSEF